MYPFWAANLGSGRMLGMEVEAQGNRGERKSLQAISEYLMSETDQSKALITGNTSMVVPDYGMFIEEGEEAGRDIQNLQPKKHKRMIKNRESASRSRARRLAYTTQLEYEISQLKKENEALRKERLLENLAKQAAIQGKSALRRVSSAEF
ncbi:ABSCISIC ACID-INSENSITIVE 5-like protein 2 [Nymphaea colorata]|nr:ABSCISIC ACID-INSENSITIVE 5-like protein 2 [Nymphaea colorata]